MVVCETRNFISVIEKYAQSSKLSYFLHFFNFLPLFFLFFGIFSFFKIAIDFNDEKISKAIIAYHVDELGIKGGADCLSVPVFDFIVLLMDHIWKGGFFN